MSSRIRINLSSEPFIRTRSVVVGATAAGVLLLGLLGLLISLSVMERGQADEAQPVVLVRGLSWPDAPTPGATLVRRRDEDLFR